MTDVKLVIELLETNPEISPDKALSTYINGALAELTKFDEVITWSRLIGRVNDSLCLFYT